MTIVVPIRTMSAKTAIIKAWLIAGTLDLSSAFLYYYFKTGNNPLKILNFIAGGIFGEAAFTGGVEMAVLGFLLHFLIAFLFTVFFFMIYPQLRKWIKSTIAAGLLYGIFVWSVMNLVVIKLSALPQRPFNIESAFINMLILMFAIGLPVSIIIGKYYRGKK